MKKINFLKKYAWIIIVVIGVTAMVYPFISQQYYGYLASKNVVKFDKEANNLVKTDIDKRIKLAQAYNQTLNPFIMGDPYTDKEKEQAKAEYARMLEVHEDLGYVEIPSIDQKIVIKAGTSEDVLSQYAGHLEGSSLPVGGRGTHTVITAHRGLPSAKLFTDLDKVRVGDVFYIKNIKEIMAYEVDQILTVEPSDFDPVMAKRGKDYATLLTCTPYMINSHRLLVRGHRVPFSVEQHKKEEKKNLVRKIMYVIMVLAFAVLAMLYWINRVALNRMIVNRLSKYRIMRFVLQKIRLLKSRLFDKKVK